MLSFFISQKQQPEAIEKLFRASQCPNLSSFSGGSVNVSLFLASALACVTIDFSSLGTSGKGFVLPPPHPTPTSSEQNQERQQTNRRAKSSEAFMGLFLDFHHSGLAENHQGVLCAPPKKPWLKPLLVGIYREIVSFQGVFGGAGFRPSRVGLCFPVFRGIIFTVNDRWAKCRWLVFEKLVFCTRAKSARGGRPGKICWEPQSHPESV